MTYKKAYEIVCSTLADGLITLAIKIIEFWETIKKALKKQIPKKPKEIGDDYSSYVGCSDCGQPIVNVWCRKDYKPKYCHFCGQRLDWSE